MTPEVLDHCSDLLSSEDSTLRIEALNILVRAKRIETGTKRAENLLRHILADRELAPDVRMKAARSLVELEVETALDLVFDITTSPEETMEAGIEAMQFLYYRDEFLATDGGHDVVWDKKLSLDQFIEAAHVFLSMVHHRHNSTFEPMAEGICGAMLEALQKIAADPAQPIERRFAAARVKDPSDSSNQLDEPFWPGVNAICQDEATPIRLRWPAIRYALHKDPARIEHWRSLLNGGEFSHLETAYLYLAADWRDEAAEGFHRALAEESDLHIRVQIWKELVLLVEWPFAGREAARALSEAIKSGAVESLTSELLEDLLMLSKAALPTDESIKLAKGVVNHQGLSAYDIEPAARILVEYGATTVVSTILEARKNSAQNQSRTDDMAFYELIYLHRLQSQLIIHSPSGMPSDVSFA